MKKYINILKGVKIPWILVAIMFVVTIFEGQFAVKTVKLTADIIDSARNTIELNQLLRYIGFLLGTVAVGIASTWLGGITYGRIEKEVRKKMLRHILNFPNKFYDEHDGKELTSRILNDCSSASSYFEILFTTVGALYTASLAFINLYKYNEKLSGYSLLIIPVTIVIAIIYGKITYVASKKSVDSNAVTTGYLFERVGAFQIIKAYNTQKIELDKSKGMFHKMFQADVITQMALAYVQVGMQIINCICIVISFVFGAKLVKDGSLTVGELVAFYSLSGTVGVQFINLYLSYGGFTSINGSLNEVSKLFLMEEESTDGMALQNKTGDIVFDNVSFGYLNRNVLNNINFTINQKEVTAIIGTNGAGKSTLFKLLQRMYEPTDGKITFDGNNLSDISIKEWRDNIAVVSQSAPLIAGTIRDNMCYGASEEVSDEKLIEISKACGIYDYISSLENGFDSEISVGSSNLSGGQRQAIAIARALIKDSEYLLLDEATKSLDASNEKIVEEALASLMKNRTTIMIAHNPSAIVNADRIIVMEDGRVSDCGTPDELLQRNDYYQSFVRV